MEKYMAEMKIERKPWIDVHNNYYYNVLFVLS